MPFNPTASCECNVLAHALDFDDPVSRLAAAGGTLETPAICALLPVIDTVEDDLWKLLRPRALVVMGCSDVFRNCSVMLVRCGGASEPIDSRGQLETKGRDLSCPA